MHIFQNQKDKIAFDNAPPPGWPVMANASPWGRQSCKMPNKCPGGGGGGGDVRGWNWWSHKHQADALGSRNISHCHQ